MKLDASGLESTAPIFGQAAGFLMVFGPPHHSPFLIAVILMDFRKRQYKWLSQQKGQPLLLSFSRRVLLLLLILDLAWEAIYLHNL